MYLTDKHNHVTRQLSDHEELEVLLESFAKQVEEIVNEAENIHVSLTLTVVARTMVLTVLLFRATFSQPKK